MKELEERILKDGEVLSRDIIKVGSFLNQNIDTGLLDRMAEEVVRLFDSPPPTKILTIESSGIPLAVAVGLKLGVPVVFAKKHRSSNVDGEVYGTSLHSFTHNEDYQVILSQDYLHNDDKVLIVDDFLANGQASKGLINICNQAGAEVLGIAVSIEKCFQGGGDSLRALGYRVEALASIEEMSREGIKFRL